MAHLTLISGGVRSGKSAFALEWARGRGQRRVFIATAQAFDPEMQSRIRAHKLERAAEFTTLEAPLDITGAVDEAGRVHQADVVVIDCLTLLLSNWLLAGSSDTNTRPSLPSRTDTSLESRVDALAQQLRQAPFDTIIVSNEVGMGIVPDNALSRRFRDLAGRAHQTLARNSDQLLFTVMGTVLQLKPKLDVMTP